MAKKSSKLKDIISEELGGLVSLESIGSPLGKTKDSASLLKMAKQLVAKEEDEKLMTREDLVEKVSNFASFGPSIYKKHNLAEVANEFVEISKAAQKHVVEETADWFDRVTVQRNMNDLKKQAAGFSKISTEAQALQDRMAALYEDMGGILNRYFEIKELNESKLNEDRTPEALRKVKINAKEISQGAKALSKAVKDNHDKDMIDEVLSIIYFAEELKKVLYDKKSYQEPTQNR